MTLAALLILAAETAGLLILLARKDQAHTATVQALTATTATAANDLAVTLTAAIAAERAEFIATIDRLCQRVQAPDVAVAVQAAIDLPDPSVKQYVGFDNDEEHRAAMETYEPLSQYTGVA